MKLHLSSHLHHLTGGASTLDVSGRTIDAALSDLDRRFPGIRFRIIDEQDNIRPHLNIFINEDLADSITAKVKKKDTLHIIAALSGG